MRRSILASGILALVAAAISCSRPPSAGRSVVLVTLDTTRADHLGVYGSPDARTPQLDRLARSGTLFVDAIIDVPVTLPSHTTIMTGIPALGHGVRYNADFRVGPEAATLAEAFAGRGYDTAAIVSSLIVESSFGLDQGFRVYDDALPPYAIFDASKYPTTHWLPAAERRAKDVVNATIAWLGARKKTSYFLWAHLYDAHFPYDPPAPWEKTSSSEYQTEINSVDRELARLLFAVDSEARGEETMIVVTADHGEGLDQHREENHGIFVYDDTIRVPLLVRAKGVLPEGRLVPELARSVDLAPTILEATAAPTAALGIGGSLVAIANGAGAPPDTAGYAESVKTKLFYSGSGLKALRTKNAKYILAPRPELYDLERDPGETRNLLESGSSPGAEGARRAQLAALVRSILSGGHAIVEAANTDEETLEGIRSLGYVAGSDGTAKPGSADSEMTMTGYDPKDLVDVSMGAREIQNGFYERGEKKLRRFFATATTPEKDPSLARLWAAAHLDYAKIWMARENYLEAANEYARALEVDPGYDEAAWSRVYALNLAGEPGLAERAAAARLETNPNAWKVAFHRAFALAFLGRGEEARAELERITRGAPRELDASRGAAAFLRTLGTAEERRTLEAYRTSEKRMVEEASTKKRGDD